ncbi:hypothetical protein Scep_024006 [Stephania cephalantha]|uniref:Uncharacterized protein n=1 Tax=Stephania cephalantha TaxID=152367 RepID=A0AAP0HXV3_9MAGN
MRLNIWVVIETEEKRQLHAENRRVLKEMQAAAYNKILDLSSELPVEDYTSMYMDETELANMRSILRNQKRTLRNQNLMFQNQQETVRSVHGFERKMTRRSQRR